MRQADTSRTVAVVDRPHPAAENDAIAWFFSSFSCGCLPFFSHLNSFLPSWGVRAVCLSFCFLFLYIALAQPAKNPQRQQQTRLCGKKTWETQTTTTNDSSKSRSCWLLRVVAAFLFSMCQQLMRTAGSRMGPRRGWLFFPSAIAKTSLVVRCFLRTTCHISLTAKVSLPRTTPLVCVA
jgi:hypothetical protein